MLASISEFWDDYDSEIITGVIAVVVAIVVARIVDRAIASRGGKLGKVVGADDLSPETNTRLRLLRRLVSAVIIVIGISFALLQFPGIRGIAAGVLASSAVLGLVVGFAARQVFANAVAGILLAITQPIRIGDVVKFEDDTGTVEDIQLTYTYLRAGDGRRVIIPNERLAQSKIDNYTITDPKVHVEVSLWIPTHADVGRALELLTLDEEGVDAYVADMDHEGIRIVAGTWAPSPAERQSQEAGLRVRCLERLQRGSILISPPAGD